MHFTKFTVFALIGLAAAVPVPNDRDDGGDNTSTSCSNSQSTVCCDKSGKNCEIKDSCNNDAVIMCGNILSGLGLGRRDDRDDGDNTATSCSNGQSAMCCNKAGKNCEIKNSCSNSAVIYCGNVLDGLLGKRNDRDDGDNTATSCSSSQSTSCCDKAGKNCQIKDSCSNSATIFCGNTISVPVGADLGSILRRTDRDDNDDGDNTSTSCSNNQSTMCCNKAGKNCSIQDSCSNDAVIICGNSVSVPITVDVGDLGDLLGRK